MLKNPLFWYASMALTALGWLFFLFGLFVGLGGFFKTLWIVLGLIFFIIHPLEVLHGIKVGEKAGVPKYTAALKTFIFGLTWWIPLKNGVFND
ncbi:MAG: hypothetical protein JEZ02_02080 [Desulfatibacillum sp.]|nr:hypothetical protein [Desulfatibacillum sp.]